MIPIFAMTVIAGLFLALLTLAVPAIAQPGEVPHGVAEWVAGLELWMLGGISGIFVLVYGWLLLTVLDARDRITKLEGWRDATRERLESGKASMSEPQRGHRDSQCAPA